MRHRLALLLTLLVALPACDKKDKTPEMPPTPDVALPDSYRDAGASDAAAKPGDAFAVSDTIPVAKNFLPLLPDELGGVKVKRKNTLETKPVAYANYQKSFKQIYNVHIVGPVGPPDQRKAAYPMLGKKGEKTRVGELALEGLEIKGYPGQLTVYAHKHKSEVVVMPNQYVEVKVSVTGTDDARAAIPLAREIDLDKLAEFK